MYVTLDIVVRVKYLQQIYCSNSTDEGSKFYLLKTEKLARDSYCFYFKLNSLLLPDSELAYVSQPH